MNKKTLIIYGLILVVVQGFISLGVFVTFPQMAAYAAPKDSIVQIEQQLNRIEEKIDKLMGY